jgi:hypothetical protein
MAVSWWKYYQWIIWKIRILIFYTVIHKFFPFGLLFADGISRGY